MKSFAAMVVRSWDGAAIFATVVVSRCDHELPRFGIQHERPGLDQVGRDVQLGQDRPYVVRTIHYSGLSIGTTGSPMRICPLEMMRARRPPLRTKNFNTSR